ncbi:MAG: hypothetical protein COX19_07505 [Desulfobacterales bacterium CG23_combo_of_CG06-09_8_20_14_all_51_8]|nr:MAG: hypothetical protein COX19_07505 [Desulfobacterales bacterium CG23_combo_of_CG06-09_8_20_14_all_51_8]
MNFDPKALAVFEDGLNPAFPDKSKIVPEILGYGEISTTFSFPSQPEAAFKRLPPFQNAAQIADYRKIVETYCSLLADDCGIRVTDCAFYDFINRHDEHILYVAQPRLSRESIGHNRLKTATPRELETLLRPLLDRLMRIFQFNKKNPRNLTIGLDGQLSNWSFPLIDNEPVYFDITTPLFRVQGREQLDTEIFLTSCPSFMVWLVRWRFLSEVLDRYYDVRLILTDLVANFYKEGRPDLIETALSMINSVLEAKKSNAEIQILEKSEIERYYKNDAFIWSLFLRLRRFDRFLKTKIFRRRYNFMLPGKIRR